MKKDFAWFFAAMATGGVAIFILIVVPATAHAYAVTPGGQPAPAQFGSSSFDFGNSLNTLFSPFQNFIKSIQQSATTKIDIRQGSVAPAPNLRLDIGAYFVQLDDWIYAKTGFRPSGIFVVALGALSWVLGVVKQIVDWLLGLVHG